MASITHTIGGIFQPVFRLFGWLLAFFYGLIPNYGVAIALLTIVIMGALTPLTIKSTRSMMAMQKLQPEIKKLQQKYKGPENRQMMNDELMRLYREEGVNPIGGCLPLLLQAPFLFILYSVIKGLSHTVTSTSGKITALPRYIPSTGSMSKMYESLIHSVGHINVWGMDLSLKPFSSGLSVPARIPFFALAAVAVALQYFQMAQMNNRNKKTGQSLPSQQQTMQRILPIVFAYFYMVIPAAVVLYMIFSTVIRIITQDLMFRTGVSNPHKGERALPAGDAVEPAPEVADEPRAKPSTPKPQQPSRANNRSKSQPRTAPKPQSQPRSKAKRKRKAR
jgi:YidC/Oxa1 family membrane protein insertase